MLITPTFLGPTGLAGTIGVQAYSLVDQATLLAHTTAGVTENPAGSGVYCAAYTVADAPQWIEVWDDGAGTYTAESKQAISIVGGAITTSNGVSAGGTVFVIKRGDSAPSITYQARDSAGTPVDISGAAIMFKMRLVPDSGSLVVNRAGRIVNGPSGLMAYDWQHTGADTATAAEYDAEFQVTFPGGSVETFPTTDPDSDAPHEYITVKIPKDLD